MPETSQAVNAAYAAGLDDPLDNRVVEGIYQRYASVVTRQDRNVILKAGQGFATNLQGDIYVDPKPLGPGAPIEDQIIVTKGGIEHELAHEKWSPRQVLHAAGRIARGQTDHKYSGFSGSDLSENARAYQNHQGQDAVSEWLNVIEDGRIERLLQSNVPGAFKRIRASDFLDPRWDEAVGDGVHVYHEVVGAGLYESLPNFAVQPDTYAAMSDDARRIFDRIRPIVQQGVSDDASGALRAAAEVVKVLDDEGIFDSVPNPPSNVDINNFTGSMDADGSMSPDNVGDPIPVNVRNPSPGHDGDGEEGSGKRNCPQCGQFLPASGVCSNCGWKVPEIDGSQLNDGDQEMNDDSQGERGSDDSGGGDDSQGEERDGSGGGDESGEEQGEVSDGSGGGGGSQSDEDGEDSDPSGSGSGDQGEGDVEENDGSSGNNGDQNSELDEEGEGAGGRGNRQGDPEGEDGDSSVGEGDEDNDANSESGSSGSDHSNERDKGSNSLDDGSQSDPSSEANAGNSNDDAASGDSNTTGGNEESNTWRDNDAPSDGYDDEDVEEAKREAQELLDDLRNEEAQAYANAIDTYTEDTARNEARKLHDGQKSATVKYAEGDMVNVRISDPYRPNDNRIRTIDQYRRVYAGAARRFSRELQSVKSEVEADKPFRRRGQLDRRRMKSAVKGDRRVYYKPGIELDQDIAVAISVDRSGSMGSPRSDTSSISEAVKAATITSMAMEQSGIPYEIRSFEGANQMIHKTFADPKATDEQLASMLYTGGSTPMKRASEITRAALSVREEGIKLAFILADGGPTDYASGGDTNEPVRKAFDAMEAQGITPVLVFAMKRDMDHWMKDKLDDVAGQGRWVHVQNPASLHRIVSDRIKDIYRNAERT